METCVPSAVFDHFYQAAATVFLHHQLTNVSFLISLKTEKCIFKNNIRFDTTFVDVNLFLFVSHGEK